jgi:tetratricopeptide (TPR) repeat protein
VGKLTIAILGSLLVSACGQQTAPPPEPVADPQFVGTELCASCHEPEYVAWQGSHHQLAMQPASDETVLGRFSNAELKYRDELTSFYRSGDKFVVRTSNEADELEEYEVLYTFGVLPLQQYLVASSRGRMQALPFAWDTRPAGDGGQRWYSLYPDDEVDHEDPLHWTGRFYNWNYMCAECHSTNVEVGYDLETNTFDTRYDEISVGCEACHGPGSSHLAQAEGKAFDATYGLAVNLDDRAGAAWVMNAATGIAGRSTPNVSRQQAESCGRCHARRGPITERYEYGKPLADTHMIALLDELLYYPDGRIQDEVYVYGSFVQSRMIAAGVTCSDCHNPHSATLHTGPNPNDVCSTCHLPAKFASQDHAGEGSENCVDCHMPATTYMGVDDRRDHSFRLPTTASDPEHYGHAIAAGRAGRANAELLQATVNDNYPAIARATMLTLLEPEPTTLVAETIAKQLGDPDPLVRVAALRALQNQPSALRLQSGSQLLRDPVRSVRIEAARTYVEYRDLLPLADARAFPAAADEYRQALLATASLPGSLLNLAEFESLSGNAEAASKLYRQMLALGADFASGRHAYGLWLVRNGQPEAALDHLRAATEIEPDVPRFAYVYGIALNSSGLVEEGITILKKARNDFPEDYDIAWGLATMLRDNGDFNAARSLAREMLAQYPDDANFNALLRSLPSTPDRQ